MRKYTTNAVESLTYSNIGRTISYRYDGAGNISRVVDSQNGTDEQTDYLYDGLNQLIRVNDSAAGKTTTYTYDAGGNILTKRRYSYTTGSLDGRGYVVVQYTYGNENWKDLLTAYNGNAITYDAIGNPLTYYNGTTFTWDAGRQLSTATKADGTELSFKYNDSGIRTSKTVGGVTTEYFLDGTGVIAEKTGNNILWFYYDGDGSREAVEYNGAVYYYLYNAQGDVLGLFDNNLNVVVNYTYDSWGNVLSVTGDMANTLGQANPFRYRGYYYDTETGLYYLNSRYYDPETGRFINADDIAYLGMGGLTSFNLFSYSGNNPIMGYDPYGSFDVWEFAKGVGRLITGIAAAAAGVAVCVAGAPVAMVAVAVVTITAGVLTVVNGTADIQQSITGNNFVRDTVFKGDKTAYNIYSGATEFTAIVGSIICGNYLSTNCIMKGAVPETKGRITLEPGTTLDRYGSQYGRYLTDPGTSINQLALTPGNSCKLTTYVVNRPFTFSTGIVAPCAWGPGGGVQYLTWMSIQRLVQFGFLTPLG